MRRPLLLAAGLFGVSAAIVGLVVVLAWRQDAQRLETAEQAELAHRVDTAVHTIEGQLRNTAEALAFLIRDPDLAHFAATGDAASRDRLEKTWLRLARSGARQEMLRFVAPDGRELLRVQGQGVATPAAAGGLQDVSRRPFFQEAMRAPAESLHLSRFDLALSGSRVLYPPEPMLRMAARFGDAGGKGGLLVINLPGRALLADVRKALSDGAIEPMLLDQDGQWLLGTRAEDEWGVMLATGRSFGRDYPAEWARINAEQGGRFASAKGMFAFRNVHPLLLATPNGGPPAAADGEIPPVRWTVVARLSPEVVAERAARAREPFLTAGVVLLALLLPLSWTGARLIEHQARARDELARSAGRLRRLVENLPAGAVYRQGDTVLLNRGAGQMLGIPWDAPMSVDGWFAAAFGAGGCEAARRRYECLRGEGFQRSETLSRRADGQDTLHVELAGTSTGEDEIWVLHDVTGRVEAERALSRSERRFRSLMRNVPGAVYRCRGEGAREFQYLSEGVEAITGHPMGAHRSGRLATLDAVVHPDDRERLRAAVDEAVANHSPYSVEHRVPRRDGGVAWVQHSGHPVYGHYGELEWLDGVLVDVTSQRALQAERERLALVVEHTTDVVSISDPAGKALYLNPAGRRLLGLEPRDSLAGRGVGEFHPDWAARKVLDEGVPVALREGYWRDETALLAPDGREVPVSQVIVAHRNPQGRVNFLASILRDVSREKAAESRMRLLARVFGAIREGIMITDPERRILEVNDAFSDVTGYSREEAVGRHAAILKSGRHGPDFYGAMWAEIGRAGSWQGEIWNRRKSGEIYPEWMTISEVRDARGVLTHYAGVFSDITQVKQAQSQMEYMAHHDALTGLPNRALLLDRLRLGLAHGRRTGSPLAVLYMDLDLFKDLNDSLGHQAGDLALKEVARRLCTQLREADTVARIGGDEFVIVAPELPGLPGAADLAQRVAVAMRAPFDIGGARRELGISIGVALAPDHGQEAELLLDQADRAMYLAKQAGRNCWRFADSPAGVDVA